MFEVCGVPAEKFRTISSAVDKLDKVHDCFICLLRSCWSVTLLYITWYLLDAMARRALRDGG